MATKKDKKPSKFILGLITLFAIGGLVCAFAIPLGLKDKDTAKDNGQNKIGYTIEKEKPPLPVLPSQRTDPKPVIDIPAHFDIDPQAKINENEVFKDNDPSTGILVAYKSTDEQDIVLDSRVKVIADGVFRYSEAATITLPEGLLKIGTEAFFRSSQFQEIKIPSTVISIGDRAFGSIPTLETVSLPKNLIFVGQDAFASTTFYNTLLQKSIAQNTPIVFGKVLYSWPNAKGDVSVADGIVTIASYAAKYSKITELNIPSSVKYIETGAFQGNKLLKTLILPEGVVSLGANAFANCDNLDDVELPNSLKIIGRSAFFATPFISKLEKANIDDNTIKLANNLTYLN